MKKQLFELSFEFSCRKHLQYHTSLMRTFGGLIPDNSTLVLDNGAGLIKLAVVDLSSGNDSVPKTIPNALAKPASNAIPAPSSIIGTSRRPPGYLVAGEIQHAPDLTGMIFRRPHDRGILTSFDVERDIWASAFSSDCGIAMSSDTVPSLLLTEPLGVPVRVRHATDELCFELFGFPSYSFSPPQRLAAATTATGTTSATCIVLDSGFSATTAVPVVNGREIQSAARRLSLGGKALTNLLKQIVSFRSWNMSDEGAVINAVKERCCYVAENYRHALDNVKCSSPLEYVLPDPTRYTDPFGHVRKQQTDKDPLDQVLALRNELIAIPEALFNPSDIGLQQAGVAELIVQAVSACEPAVQPDLYGNVLLTGGNCLFPGFHSRVVSELRPLVNSDIDLNVNLDYEPIHTTYRGAISALRYATTPLNFISREQYGDLGSDGILRQIYGDQNT